MKEFGIESADNQAMFIAQAGHESSGFTHIVESLNYSADGLKATFGKYFTDDTASQYGRTADHPAQSSLNRLAATITDMQVRQEQLAELDKTHTEALSAVESENNALRRQLAADTRRMYVHAKCPVSGAGTAAGSVRLPSKGMVLRQPS